MAESKLQKARRRFQAESSDENYRKFAKQALRAGKPLVRFGVVCGVAAAGPRDPDGSCVWIEIRVSGRALDAGAEIRDDEWVTAHLGQLPASLEVVARMQADAMNEFEPAQLERWTEREEVNRVLRLSGVDRMSRVMARAQGGASFREHFEAAGFWIWHTGGGCTAWRLDGPLEDQYVMVTGEDAYVPESDDESISVGYYQDGDWGDLGVYVNNEIGVQNAIAAARHALGYS
jgi:hypothetical protein